MPGCLRLRLQRVVAEVSTCHYYGAQPKQSSGRIPRKSTRSRRSPPIPLCGLKIISVFLEETAVPFESRDPEVIDSGAGVISSSSGSLRESAVVSCAGRFGIVRSLLALAVSSVGSRVPRLPARKAASPSSIFLPRSRGSVGGFASLRFGLGGLRNGRIDWRQFPTSRGIGRSISRVRRFEIRSAVNCSSRDSFFELVPGRVWASRSVEQRRGRRPLRGRSVASGAGIVCGLSAAALSSVGSRGRRAGSVREAGSPVSLFLPTSKVDALAFESSWQSVGGFRNGRAGWRRVTPVGGFSPSVSRAQKSGGRSETTCTSSRWFFEKWPGRTLASRNGERGRGRRPRGAASGACELPVKTAGGPLGRRRPEKSTARPPNPGPQVGRLTHYLRAVVE